MLYDRPYMRAPSFGGRASSFLKFLLVLLIASFVLQAIIHRLGFGDIEEYAKLLKRQHQLEGQEHVPESFLAEQAEQLSRMAFFSWTVFTPDGLLAGKFWTLVTYAFLHSGPLHLVFNLLMIFFMGRALEDDLGPKMMTWLTLVGAASGALLWVLFNSESALVGASAIVFAYLTTFCLRHPEQPITLLLFFVIPCTVKPRLVLWGALGITLFCFLFYELNGSPGVAHSAHLGGMLAGLFFFSYVRSGGTSWNKRPRLQKPSWLKVAKQSRKSGTPSDYSVNLDDREMVEQEVDRILDKINDKGFGSLNEDEKRTLDKAKSLLGK
jgi:membrane associated rhomboid family serine protease